MPYFAARSKGMKTNLMVHGISHLFVKTRVAQ
jgi:hypothetical protein